MSLRKEREALALRIISYFENEAGRSRNKTWRHFRSENVRRSTLYSICRRFVATNRRTYRKLGGGPKPTVKTPENIKRMEEVLKVNPTISSKALAKQLNLGHGSVSIMLGKWRKEKQAELRLCMSESLEPGTSKTEGGDQRDASLTSCGSPMLTLASPVDGDNVQSDWNAHDDKIGVCGATTSSQCFICDTANAVDLDLTFPSLIEMPKQGPAEVEKSAGVICFLKNVMGMPNYDLVNLMKETEGKSPNQWNISVCADPGCRGSVEKAFSLWREINNLEAHLRKRRQQILERIRNCFQETTGIIGDEDDHAVLNGRVRELVKRGSRSIGEEEVEGLTEPVVEVKTEPQGEDLPGQTDASWDGELGEEWDLQNSTMKVESNDDARYRRSSRPKRKSQKLKSVVKLEPGDDDLPELTDASWENDSGEEWHQRDSPAKAESKRRSSRKNRKPQKLECGVTSPGKPHRPTEVKMKAEVKAKAKEPSTREAGPPPPSQNGQVMYSCRSCPTLEEMDVDKFIAHVTFHSRNPQKCSECNFYFAKGGATEEQVGKHWEERHPDSQSTTPKVIQVAPEEAAGKIWLCSEPNCNQEFVSSEERNGHELGVHGMDNTTGDLNCPLCPSKLKNVQELRLHKAIQHPDDAMVSCCYCTAQFGIELGEVGIKFLNLDKLREHISQEHPDHLKINAQTNTVRLLETCPMCGLVVSCVGRHIRLDQHIVREHGQNIHEAYTCPICGKKMRNADAWNHTKVLHWPDAPRRYVCQFCGKGFHQMSKRAGHEEIHLNKNLKPYQCEICGSSFSVYSYLYLHRRVTHQGYDYRSGSRKRKSHRRNDDALPNSTKNLDANGQVEDSGQSQNPAPPDSNQ